MKTLNLKTVTLIASSLVFSSQLMAQSCFDNIIATSASENFTLNSDGTALDNRTGIMWYRCSVGQSWDQASNTCSGGVDQVNWQQALKLANDFEAAGHADWQLPNVKELGTLVERQCVDAAINSTVFPNTSPANYWSSTSGVGSASFAWAVAFYSGKSNLRSKLSDVHVRVMRYAK